MAEHRVVDYLYILGTVLFTVYGQIVLKWQVSQAGDFPAGMWGKLEFIVHMLLNPWVISGLVGAFVAFLCWMVAMTRFQLNYAYPLTSLGFALVMVLGVVFFRETLSLPKVLGVAFIMVGIAMGSQG